MAVIERNNVIEGAVPREATGELSADLGPFTNAGLPTGGLTLAGVAAKGALLIDTTNGVLYINTGSKATPTWTMVGGQA